MNLYYNIMKDAGEYGNLSAQSIDSALSSGADIQQEYTDTMLIVLNEIMVAQSPPLVWDAAQGAFIEPVPAGAEGMEEEPVAAGEEGMEEEPVAAGAEGEEGMEEEPVAGGGDAAADEMVWEGAEDVGDIPHTPQMMFDGSEPYTPTPVAAVAATAAAMMGVGVPMDALEPDLVEATASALVMAGVPEDVMARWVMGAW